MSDPAFSRSASEPLTLRTKLAYGAGDLGTAITANILGFYLLFFFTSVAGLNAGLAANVLLISKIWDAVNDPIVGVLSDRTQSNRGRRYPWMIWGAIPFGITFVLQWLVPRFSNDPTANQWGLFWYYVIIAILFNSFYTMVNLPYTALTAELTQDYNERTSLNSFRFAFSLGGSIVSIFLVILISSLIPDPNQQYFVIGVVCAVISVLAVGWCVWGTRERAAVMETLRLQHHQDAPIPLLEQLRIAFSNRPFLLVIGIYLCSWLAVQLTASILKFFAINWMGYSDLISNIVILVVLSTSMAMLFVWNIVSNRVGKKATYFMGMGLWIIAQTGLFFLQPGQTVLMFTLAIVAGMGVATAYLIPWSMLPDVIELDELRTGQRREGIFYSFMVLLQKIGLALGLFAVGQALEAAGFIESVPGQPVPVQPDSALLAIRIAIGPFPTLVLIAGVVLAYLYPITREVHAEILLKLRERREQRDENLDR